MQCSRIPTCVAIPALLAGILIGADQAVAVKPVENLSATRISVPSGPGAVEGLGESFEPQWNTGTYRFSLPLRLPPVRGKANPQIGIAYDSANGNGPLGMGWKLDVPFVQRQTDKGLPSYGDTDRLIDWTGEELVRAMDGSRRARNESSFLKWTPASAGWQALRPDGTKLLFGTTEAARLERPKELGGGVFRWMLESAEDTNGNRAEYRYRKDAGQIYLEEIVWGLHNSGGVEGLRLVFGYMEGRPDVLTDYRGRFAATTRLRLDEITLFLGDRRIRHWRMDYLPDRPLSLLAAVVLSGDERSKLGEGARMNVDFLPPMNMEYSSAAFPTKPAVVALTGLQSSLDFSGRQANRTADFVDLDGDALPDVLYCEQGRFRTQRNAGGEVFEPNREVTTPGNFPQIGEKVRITDIRGDSRPRLVYPDPNAGTGTAKMLFRELRGLLETGPVQEYAGAGAVDFSNPQVQLADINNDRAMDLVRKGRAQFEYLLSNTKPSSGNGFADFRVTKNPLADSIDFTDRWQLVDVGGDRLPDLVRIATRRGSSAAGGIAVFPGRGLGEFDPRASPTGGPTDDIIGSRGIDGFSLADLDMDGLADIVQVESGLVRVWRNRDGRSFDSSPSVTVTSGVPVFDGTSTAVRFVDLNANGSTDIVWIDPKRGAWMLDFFPGTKPNLLTGYSNGIGKTTRIFHVPSTKFVLAAVKEKQPWSSLPPFPVPVVERIEESDGRGNTYVTRAVYRDGYYDSAQREFRGFRSTMVTEVGDAAAGAPSLVTEYVFDTGRTNEALKGRPLSIEAREEGGAVFHTTQNTWNARKLPVAAAAGETLEVVFPEQTSETKTIAEKSSGSPVTTKREMTFDDFGNCTSEKNFGRLDASWGDERITSATFTAADPSGVAAWILNLPVRQETADGAGKIFSRSVNFYDGLGEGVVTKGNCTLVRRFIEPASGNDSIESDKTTYDSFGNPVSIRDGNGNLREFAYGEPLRTHPTTETVHTAGAGGALVFQAAYDSGLGVMNSITDPNGVSSSFQYDTFGRLVTVVKPGDSLSAPTTSYEYGLAVQDETGRVLNSTTTRQRESADGGTLDSVVYTDGLGRTLQTRSEGESSGQTVVTGSQTFNARRGPRRQFLPYFDTGGFAFTEPSAQPAVKLDCDALGRVLVSTRPDGSFSRSTYEPLAVVLEDEEQASGAFKGKSNRQISDGLGRLRVVEERVEPSPYVTTYTYDVLDNWTGYTDAQGNKKFLLYDGLSRLIAMLDPDRGAFWWCHDAVGNVIRTRDAKGQEVAFAYDGANRVTAEWYLPEGGSAPDPLTRWKASAAPEGNPEVVYHYDLPAGDVPFTDFTAASGPGARLLDSILGRTTAPGPGEDLNGDSQVDVRDLVLFLKNGGTIGSGGSASAEFTKGRLAWIKDLSGEEHRSYDARGRSVWKIKRIKRPDPLAEPLSFMVGNSYDSADRPVELRYPDGSSLDIRYNARGLPSAMPGIVSAASYEASGLLASISLTCGVETVSNFDLRQRPVRRTSTRGADGTVLLDYGYTFDRVSNITAIADRRPSGSLAKIATEVGATKPADLSEEQNFTYDALYRLTRASGAGIGGTLAYAYDKIGNLVSQTSTVATAAGKELDLGSVTNGGEGGTSGRAGDAAPGPHALTATGSGLRLDYDLNGNVLRDGGSTYSWDILDRMVGAANAQGKGSYLYDYAGQRMRRDVDTLNFKTTVYYPAPACEFRDGKFLKYAHFGNQRVARSDEAKAGGFVPDRFYLHDHLGSTRLTLSATGSVLEARSDFPYGHARFSHTAPAAAAEPYAFSGKEHDKETGLHYFEARFFNAPLGSFATVDPICERMPPQRRMKPQRGNLYRYCSNQPIVLGDPTGCDEEALKFDNDLGELVSSGKMSPLQATTYSVIYKVADFLSSPMKMLEKTEHLDKVPHLPESVENSRTALERIDDARVVGETVASYKDAQISDQKKALEGLRAVGHFTEKAPLVGKPMAKIITIGADAGEQGLRNIETGYNNTAQQLRNIEGMEDLAKEMDSAANNVFHAPPSDQATGTLLEPGFINTIK